MSLDINKICNISLSRVIFVLILMGPVFCVQAQTDAVDCDDIINFDVENLTGGFGEIVCVDVQVRNFESILALQIPFNFNPTILRYESCHPVPEVGTFMFDCLNVFDFEATDGVLKILWFDVNGIPQSLPDGTTVLNLCFEIIGEPKDDVPVLITNFGLPIEYVFQNPDGTDSTINVICQEGGIVDIICDDYNIYSSVCNTPTGTNDGQISFYACGGFPPYNYTINGESGTLADDKVEGVISNLAPGVYDLIILDANNESRIESIEVSDGANLSLATDVSNPSCANGRFPDGFIRAEADGGAEPYNYSWSITPSNTDLVQELSNGSYTVSVEDAAGCKLTEDIDLFTPPIEVSLDITSLPACEGGTRLGTAIISATGGNPINGSEYEFEIFFPDGSDEDQITDQWIFNQIPPGEIKVVAKDSSNFCTSETVRWVVNASKTLEIDITPNNVGCTSTDDGSIDIVVTANGSPAVAPYRYFLLDENGNAPLAPVNITDANFTYENLTTGRYTLVVSDGEGCEATAETEISIGLPLQLQLVDLEQPGCTGTGLGSIEVIATGGSGVISYSWDDGPTGATRTDLAPGVYMVTAFDEKNCMAVESFDLSIDNNGSLSLDEVIITPLLCRGDNNAAISIEVTGGNQGITFDWGDGPTSENSRFGLSADTYTVDIVSDNGCSRTEAITIEAIPAFDFVPNEDLPICPGQTGNIGIELTGGTEPYTYLWDHPNNTGGSILPAVESGVYLVTVTDNNNCTFETSLTLNDPPAIVANIISTNDVSCFGFSDGQATVSAQGGSTGNTSFQYLWSSGENLFGEMSTAVNLEAGEQWVIATDNQCISDTLKFMIGSPESVTLDLNASTINSPSCFGRADGSVILEATGGTAPYTYQWPQFGNTGASQSNLLSDTLVVFIRDNRNCEQEDRFFLPQPDSMALVVDSTLTDNVNCFSDATAVITVETIGGNQGALDYNWTDDVSNTNVAANLNLGVYDIMVTDSKGCTAATAYQVNSPDPILADVPIPEPPLCFGDKGIVSVASVSGGSGTVYKYSINNGPLNDIDTELSLLPGNYSVKVFDQSGCFAETDVTILQAEELVVSIPDTLALDLGTEQLINVQVSGPATVESFEWTPMEDIDCISPACNSINIQAKQENTYTVTVRDVNGCVSQDDMLLLVNDNRNVYIPNAFNPNQGLDNRLAIYTGIGVERVNYFRIFDRLGNKVHDSAGEGSRAGVAPWDGKYKGKIVDPGVFVYRAEILFTDNEPLIYAGTITVLK